MKFAAMCLLLALPTPLAEVIMNETCKVGDDVVCYGSPHTPHCGGNICCPSALGSFVCPSAEPGWNECHRPKRYDCVRGEIPDALLPEAVPYYPHFDTTPDYLGIAARARGVNGNEGKLSDNYYLTIGDFGGCGGGCAGCCEMQMEVADKMAEYVAQRKRANPLSNLLFVLALGDAFYWNGATEAHFNVTWLGTYAPELLQVPWFAVMGNHDYGNDDYMSACPSIKPRFMCDDSNIDTHACGGARPYSRKPQGYSSNQLNPEKGGVGGKARANFQMPDYTFYYTIPELRFELIALNWNWLAAFPGRLGGNGIQGGARKTKDHCGSAERLSAELKGVQEASTELLFQRSAAAQENNVAIISHYADEFQGGVNFRQMFLDGVPEDRKEAMTVFNFFGHTHYQECRGFDDDGRCVDFLSGGGGGCCSTDNVPAGFAAFSFSDTNTSQVAECFLDKACTLEVYGNEL